ncbi:hypothetical protein N7G274_005551 [Stereocaulon virgatum]|uniref:Cofilin n=1 Tax=Stereocaulon virgatum TaxID=373712 RepID=A0ABR4A783_9LECA
MSKSGVSVAPECVSQFNELKLGKSIKYIIYKLSDDYKEIIVEDASSDPDWETFRNKLLNAKAPDKKGKEGKGPRFAVYDFEWELESGEGKRKKIVFISWSPDEGTLVFPRMTYASSKESLKNALSGLSGEVQANRDDEIEYATILKDISRGTR